MSRSFAILFVVSVASLMFGACSDQGEGDRCEQQEDCASGLRCTPETELSVQGASRCCPLDRSQASDPACKTSASPINPGLPNVDASVPEAATVDATTDGSTADAANGNDSSSDAADDGG